MGFPILWRLMNVAASDLCGDYDKAIPKNAPKSRLVARLILATLFVLNVLLAFALYSTKTATGNNTVRYYDGAVLEHMLKSETLRQTYCPCTHSRSRWMNYTSSYILHMNSSGSYSALATTSAIKGLCSEMRFKTNSDACLFVTMHCFGMIDNEMLSQQLMMPSVFAETLDSYILQNCMTQERYYKLLLRTDALENNITGPNVAVQECRSDECIFEPLTRSLFAMHHAVQDDPKNTTDEYFIEAPKKYYSDKPTLLENGTGMAFKMNISWERYKDACKPSYCDMVVETSLLKRIVYSMAQLGGILTVMLAGLRLFVWPFLVWACAWDRPQASKVFVCDVESPGPIKNSSLEQERGG